LHQSHPICWDSGAIGGSGDYDTFRNPLDHWFKYGIIGVEFDAESLSIRTEPDEVFSTEIGHGFRTSITSFTSFA
jgi:hypothetical protein